MRDTPASLLLESALAYAARGWPVFPCHTPTPSGCSCRRDCGRSGKHPRTQHGLKDATTDPAMLHRWWHQWPEANVAIATGARSGLVVLDEDTYKGGDRSRVEIEQAYQLLPETVQQLTGGGGVQYLFAHPGTPVKNGVETLGVGLDIRGDGGYIIAPPSLHMSGRHYLWEVAHEPQETALAPCPPWLLTLVHDSARRPAPDAGAQIPDHHRNETLFQLGCAFRARGCTEAVILAALREMNSTQCAHPLEDAEVCVIAHSCAQYPPGVTVAPPRDRPPRVPPVSGAPADGPLPYSDYTNALAFVRQHGAILRYCYPWKSWLVWTGTHWQRDTSGTVMRLAKDTVKRLAQRLDRLEDEKKIAALMAHLKSSLSTPKLKALIESAQSEPGIAIQPEDIETDPWLLNCVNGTLDLRTGSLRPHRQEDLITKCLPFPFDPAARCPLWETFLWRVMGGSQGDDDPDMSVGTLDNRERADARATSLIAYLQRTAGYTLTGATQEQCLFLCHGPTKTGKSTYLATLRALTGPYGKQADMQTFMHKERAEVRNDLADLAGARYVYAVEAQEGKRLAESLIKQMTGGVDAIKARFLFEEYFEFKPQFKVYLGTNHLPRIQDSDDAIWERIRKIPFTVQIPQEQRDKGLEEKLLQELPGILAWAVRGCLAWHAGQDLQEPPAVLSATRAYRVEMDSVAGFLEDCCLEGPPDAAKIRATTLRGAYQHWCKHTGEFPVENAAFITTLEKRGYERRRGHANQYYWHGLGLVPTEEHRYE